MRWVVKATPHHFTPLIPHYPLYRRVGGTQVNLDGWRKISPPWRFDPRAVQHEAIQLLQFSNITCARARELETVSTGRLKMISPVKYSTNAQSKEWYRNLLFFSAGGGLEFHSRHRPFLHVSTPFASRCGKITQQATTLPSFCITSSS
jgi:hypothetical protein